METMWNQFGDVYFNRGDRKNIFRDASFLQNIDKHL